jgi:CBS-domain-containing membrane protein
MKSFAVKDLMVPLDEYATVGEEASLYEAVLALEAAQEKYDRSRTPYVHRAIMILDGQKKVVGKISQLDALRALGPGRQNLVEDKLLSGFGFSQKFIHSLLVKHELWREPLADICQKAGRINVRDIMHQPDEGEFISENDSLAEAIHQLIAGPHQSLLVTRSQDIVGVLRLTDVFTAVFHVMKQYESVKEKG